VSEHEDFRRFMKFLLKIDPRQRPSATEVLKHEFFKNVRISENNSEWSDRKRTEVS